MKQSDCPLFTFYMTVKDGLPFIKDAIHSIQNQTYKNIEAVIVDDGSKDGTVDYLRDLEGQDLRYKIIVTGGVGRGKALNIALKHAKGLYVANLDADDYAHPQRAEAQISCFKRTGARFLCAHSDIFYDDQSPYYVPLKEFEGVRMMDVTLHLYKRNPISHTTVAMCKDTVLSVGGYDESRNSQFDYELWIRLASAGVALLRQDQSLGCKRIHANQSFENKKRLKYLCSSVRLQCSAISQLDGKSYHYFYPALRLLYGSLPQKIRAFIKL